MAGTDKEHQAGCVACGGQLGQSQANVEAMADLEARFVYVDRGCSSFAHYDGPAYSSPLSLSSIR
jgi:hypothetical protein